MEWTPVEHLCLHFDALGPAPFTAIARPKFMPTGYTTVFEVSYFSNGTLFFSIFVLFVCAFVGGTATVIYGRMAASEAEAIREKFFIFRLVVLVCIAVSTIWFASNVYDGCKLTRALKGGECRVVEGTVQVLHREPWGGHSQNNVRIAGKEFAYSCHRADLGYTGGELLIDGVTARVHYLGNTILKVEIKQ